MFQDKLIDVGFGVLANLVRLGRKLDSINDVYISHVHSDHIGDFTGLVWAMAMEERTRPLRVVSSASAADALRSILELQGTPCAWVKFDIVFARPQDVNVKHMITLHEPENLAYRFETDHTSFVYAGDSARYEKVSEFAKGCDLLIHEATFLKGQESLASITKHSTAKDAGLVARNAGVRRLALTHISPTNTDAEEQYLAEAGESFEGPTILARDNQALLV